MPILYTTPYKKVWIAINCARQAFRWMSNRGWAILQIANGTIKESSEC